MRVAFLSHEPFYPPTGGGSAEAVYLVREMVRRGHEVTLFCPAFAESDTVAREFGLRVREFRGWEMGRYTAWRTLKYLAYPARLERLVARDWEFDLLFSQHAISSVTAGKLRRRFGVLTVMNFLDHLTGFMETWPRWAAPRMFLARLKRFELAIPGRFGGDAVLTVSDTLADRIAATGYPRERIHPIYYGYDSKLFPLRENAPARGTPPVVVMHGSLDRHHLGEIAVQAVKKITVARPETVFRFVGRETATLTGFFDRVRRVAPRARLESTGFVPYSDVARKLAGATVGIVPYEESAGTHCAFVAKIVEYLGVGLPVVSTPMESARRYYRGEPMIRFSGFDGESFGEDVLAWFDVDAEQVLGWARTASAKVAAALDWRVICRRAVDVVEAVGSAG